MPDDEQRAGNGVARARESYEKSVKRSDDAEALMERADSVLGMLRGIRRENHWADKARAELRGRHA